MEQIRSKMNTPVLVKDFEYRTLNLLEHYSGKVLVMLIYNNGCLGCTGRAIPFAYKLQQEFKTVQVIGVHSNFSNVPTTKADIKSIFTIDELPFPIYLDENHSVYDQFQSEGTPQWVIFNKEGKVHRTIFGSQHGAQNRLLYALEDLQV